MKRKIFAFLLVAVACVSLTIFLISCGNDSAKKGNTSVSENGTTDPVENTNNVETTNPVESTDPEDATKLSSEATIIVHSYETYNYIYSWTVENDVAKEQSGAWPGAIMTKEGSWNTYSFADLESVELIFNTGLGGSQTEDLTAAKGEWWFYNNTWYDHDIFKSTISFYNYDGSLLQKGSSYEGENPTKPSDEYDYKFIGWDINADGVQDTLPTSLTEDIDAHALFGISSVINIYAPSAYTYLYAKSQDGTTDLTDAYPGARMTIADEDYNMYTFNDIKGAVVVLSDGQDNKTAELNLQIGNWWYHNGELLNYNPLLVDDYKISYYADGVLLYEGSYFYAEIPTKASDASNMYTFAGWDLNSDGIVDAIPTELTENLVANAIFIATEISSDFRISFYDEDGKICIAIGVTYNGTPLTKTADSLYTYQFIGWDINKDGKADTITYPLTTNLKAVAVYKATLIIPENVINFYNYDGTLLDSGLTCAVSPTRPSDANYSYLFAGWDINNDGIVDTLPTTLTESIDAHAVYTKTPFVSYVINFFDANGTLITSGTTCTVIPTKASDSEYTYTFAGWDVNNDGVVDTLPTVLTADLNAYPVFNKTRIENNYVINFYNVDGTLITSGTTCTVIPTKASDSEYSYTFAGWDINSDGTVDTLPTVLTENLNAYPLFNKEAIGTEFVINFYNFDGTLLSSGASYSAKTPVRESDGDYRYQFIGWDFNNDGLKDNVPTTLTSTLNANALFVEVDYIRVYVNPSFTYVYAWTTTTTVTTYCGSWPGTKLEAFDENYNTFKFDASQISLIFNTGNGGSQTGDLSLTKYGNFWYVDNTWYEFDPTDTNLLNNFGIKISGGGGQKLVEPKTAASYLDFDLWEEKEDSYWTLIDDYADYCDEDGEVRDDFRDESIYFAMTTRFYDGDPSNNVDCWDGSNPDSDPAWRGDFKGLIDQMDYIKALGFTAIWITPVVTNASGYDYHGYHAIDFSTVDDRYKSGLSTASTEDDVDFQEVITAAHELNMKIVLDVVWNHTGNFGEANLFPMFEKSGDLGEFACMTLIEGCGLPANYDQLPGGSQYSARIDLMKDTKNVNSDPNYFYHHYGNFSYETFGEQMAQIAGDCVDLNTENPIVAEYLVECYGEFIRMGVDAFRIDTMKHISRLTLNKYFFPALNEIADRCGNDDFYMFGEACTRVREIFNHGIPALSAPFYTWAETTEWAWGDTETNLSSIAAFYEANKEVNDELTSTNAFLDGINYHTPDYSLASGSGVIDFPMHWNFYYAKNAFDVAVGGDKFYNDASWNVVYVDSHDYSPDDCQTVRYNRGTTAWAENMCLMFSFRGIPCIYYGTEVEFQAGKVIDNGPNTVLSETGRAYFGDYLEGSLNTTDFGEYTASGAIADTLNATLSQHLIKLNKIRQSCIALRRGQYTTSGVSGDMAFIRRYTDSSKGIDSLACVTVTGGATFSNLVNGTYVDLVSGATANVTNGTLTVGAPGEGNMRCYVLQNSYTGSLSQIGGSTTYLK